VRFSRIFLKYWSDSCVKADRLPRKSCSSSLCRRSIAAISSRIRRISSSTVFKAVDSVAADSDAADSVALDSDGGSDCSRLLLFAAIVATAQNHCCPFYPGRAPKMLRPQDEDFEIYRSARTSLSGTHGSREMGASSWTTFGLTTANYIDLCLG